VWLSLVRCLPGEGRNLNAGDTPVLPTGRMFGRITQKRPILKALGGRIVAEFSTKGSQRGRILKNVSFNKYIMLSFLFKFLLNGKIL
jgi:hypothetical protein